MLIRSVLYANVNAVLPRYAWSCNSVPVCVMVTSQKNNSYILPWYYLCIVAFLLLIFDILWGWTLLKNRIISKNASNESCWALNSVQKSQWAHVSASHQSGAKGSKDCRLLKYCHVQKRASRFTLGLDAAENMHYIQKCFRWRKSHSRSLLMFSNMFQELPVSPSAVNSFKVTNLFKSCIHIHEIWRDARFLVSKFGRILPHPQISWWVKN